MCLFEIFFPDSEDVLCWNCNELWQREIGEKLSEIFRTPTNKTCGILSYVKRYEKAVLIQGVHKQKLVLKVHGLLFFLGHPVA